MPAPRMESLVWAMENFLLTAQMQANGIEQLDITFRHVPMVAALPFHHRDPFDCFLVCQAAEKGLTLLSAEQVFDTYKVHRIW